MDGAPRPCRTAGILLSKCLHAYNTRSLSPCHLLRLSPTTGQGAAVITSDLFGDKRSPPSAKLFILFLSIQAQGWAFQGVSSLCLLPSHTESGTKPLVCHAVPKPLTLVTPTTSPISCREKRNQRQILQGKKPPLSIHLPILSVSNFTPGANTSACTKPFLELDMSEIFVIRKLLISLCYFLFKLPAEEIKTHFFAQMGWTYILGWKWETQNASDEVQ